MSAPKPDWLAHRRRQTAALLTGWIARQKPGIADKRGNLVAGACQWEVERIISKRPLSANSAILLTAEQIQECEDRVVSTERASFFKKIPPSAETWLDQTAKARAAIRANQHLDDGTAPQERGVDSVKPNAEHAARLAELAAARREGRAPKPMEAA